MKEINDHKEKNVDNKKVKLWGWASYFIAGSVFYFSNQFKKTTFDEVIIICISIIAGSYYYNLVKKLSFIKNEVIRKSISVLCLLAAAAFTIGFLTSVI